MADKVRLTMLKSMAGREFPAAVERHAAWGLKWLDLKDGLFGRSVVDLTDDEAREVRRLADGAGLGIWCMSTGLFYAEVESSEETFQRHLASVDRAITIARILEPRFIRLLAAKTRRRAEVADSTSYILRHHPWLVGLSGDAVDRIARAGFGVVIENEIHGCIWSRPEEVLSFFAALERPAARYTWDVQNMWQLGTFPTLDAYRKLRPLIGMVHLKGGQAEKGVRPLLCEAPCGPTGKRGLTPFSAPLKWSSSLADANWPIVEILREVIVDGTSPVLCLNPSHGEPKPGYDYTDIVVRDIAFLRAHFPEIE